MLGTARAPGTCGELIQGKIDGTNILVTCPVNLYSTVTANLDSSGIIKVDKSLSKVRLAAEKTLELLGLTGTGVNIGVFSDIPPGKGMASSTADISATCAAVACAAGVRLSAWDIAEIALSVEPTDGIMFPGIALFDHVEGKVARILGEAPDMELVIVDLGGTVDTVSFNANLELDNMNRLKEHKIALALEKIERGLGRGDLASIGEAAAESAFANQHILYKPELETLFQVCRELGGLGVNVAHSGTVVGLMFEADRNSAASVQTVLAERGYTVFCGSRLIGGGIEILTDKAGEKIWGPLNEYMGEIYGRQRKITG